MAGQAVDVKPSEHELPTRGWGPWRADFYSVCSRHHHSRDDCPQCNAGQWSNRIVHRIDGRIYRYARRLWLWWHNRPNSKARRTLEGIFPNLKKHD